MNGTPTGIPGNPVWEVLVWTCLVPVLLLNTDTICRTVTCHTDSWPEAHPPEGFRGMGFRSWISVTDNGTTHFQFYKSCAQRNSDIPSIVWPAGFARRAWRTHVADEGGSRLAGCSSSGPLFPAPPPPSHRARAQSPPGQGSANHRPPAKPSPLPLSVREVAPERSLAHSRAWRLQPQWQGWVLVTQWSWPTKPKQFSIWPRKECPDRCSRHQLCPLGQSSQPCGDGHHPPRMRHVGEGRSSLSPADSHHLGKLVQNLLSASDSLCSDSRCADDSLCSLGKCANLSGLVLELYDEDDTTTCLTGFLQRLTDMIHVKVSAQLLTGRNCLIVVRYDFHYFLKGTE